MDSTKEQHQIFANLGKSATDSLAMIRQAFGEECMSRTRMFEWHVQVHQERKARQVKSKVKSMLIVLFDIKGIIHLAGQIVNSVYYCDLLKRLRENEGRLHTELWRQKNRMLQHDNTPSRASYSPRIFFYQKYDCRPPPTLIFSVSPIKDKSERAPF
jgi:hypothetical protein